MAARERHCRIPLQKLPIPNQVAPPREQPWPRWPLWFGFFSRDREGKTPSWRRSTFTRLGRWYCGLTVGIGFAAINTGNNLLFLVLGVLLSSIIVSGVLSENALREIKLTRQLPLEASVGKPVLIGLTVVNEKKRAPSFSLELRELKGQVSRRDISSRALAAGARRRDGLSLLPPERRGWLQIRPARRSATRSPFGLFEKARPLDALRQLIVFFRGRSIRRTLAPRTARAARASVHSSGSASVFEVHGLRWITGPAKMRAASTSAPARAQGKLLGVDRGQERRQE